MKKSGLFNLTTRRGWPRWSLTWLQLPGIEVLIFFSLIQNGIGGRGGVGWRIDWLDDERSLIALVLCSFICFIRIVILMISHFLPRKLYDAKIELRPYWMKIEDAKNPKRVTYFGMRDCEFFCVEGTTLLGFRVMGKSYHLPLLSQNSQNDAWQWLKERELDKPSAERSCHGYDASNFTLSLMRFSLFSVCACLSVGLIAFALGYSGVFWDVEVIRAYFQNHTAWEIRMLYASLTAFFASAVCFLYCLRPYLRSHIMLADDFVAVKSVMVNRKFEYEDISRYAYDRISSTFKVKAKGRGMPTKLHFITPSDGNEMKDIIRTNKRVN